jgi:ATP-dependent Clp protease ATP-binding subunit ClpC
MKRAELRAHDEVRRAMEWANQLTIKFNHDHLGSAHLLGGLLHDDAGGAARLLREMGADPKELKRRLAASLVPGHDMVTASRLPRTPCLTRALEYASAAVDEMGHTELDARHVLLGLTAGDGPAARLLHEAGISVDALRARIAGPGRTPLGDTSQAPGGTGAGPGV